MTQSTRSTLLAVATSALLAAIPHAHAQVFDSGPSDASLFTNGVFNIPPDIAPGSVGNLQQVNLLDGGSIGTFFIANPGSEVNILGGSIGDTFQAFGSEVNILNGSIDGNFRAANGSVVNISGGSVGNDFIVYEGSDAILSGGNVGVRFKANAGSDVELIGGDFRLNGVNFNESKITLANGDIFTGTLQDGSAFIFSSSLRLDSLRGVTLTSVVLPTLDTEPMVVNSVLPSRPSGLRAGQALTLQAGGKLGDAFELVDAKLDIEGGSLGRDAAASGGVVNISDGSVGLGFNAFPGSRINVSGGSVGGKFTAWSGSSINVSGGSVGYQFTAWPGTTELMGGEFLLNGETFNESNISLDDGDVFTGTLKDGSSFIFAHFSNASSDSGRDGLYDVILNRVALPTPDTTPFVVDSVLPIRPSGLRTGQALTLQTGGELGADFEVVDAVLNITGGILGESAAASRSVVNIAGGLVGQDFAAYSGSEVNISGGSIGSGFSAFPGSEINLFGTEFFFKGVLLDELVPGKTYILPDRFGVLSGTLADGSPITLDLNSTFLSKDYFAPGVSLTLTLTPEPSSATLLTLAGVSMLFRRRGE